MINSLYGDLVENLYKTMTERTTLDGGYTFWFDASEGHHFGYCVGDNQTSLITRGFPIISRFTELLEIAHREGYDGIGMWLDIDTGLCYTDKVKWVIPLDEAVKLAKANNELAIYDLKAQECITIN